MDPVDGTCQASRVGHASFELINSLYANVRAGRNVATKESLPSESFERDRLQAVLTVEKVTLALAAEVVAVDFNQSPHGGCKPFYRIRFTKYSTSDKMMLRMMEVISGK